MGGHVARSVLQVLYADGDAGQGPGVTTRSDRGVDCFGCGPGPTFVDSNEGVDRRIVRGDLPERVVDQLRRRNRSAPDLGCQVHY